jgi:hypothetical protein
VLAWSGLDNWIAADKWVPPTETVKNWKLKPVVLPVALLPAYAQEKEKRSVEFWPAAAD